MNSRDEIKRRERELNDSIAESYDRLFAQYASFAIHFDSFEGYWEAMLKATPAAAATRDPETLNQDVRADLQRRLVYAKTGAVYMHNESAMVLARKA